MLSVFKSVKSYEEFVLLLYKKQKSRQIQQVHIVMRALGDLIINKVINI